MIPSRIQLGEKQITRYIKTKQFYQYNNNNGHNTKTCLCGTIYKSNRRCINCLLRDTHYEFGNVTNIQTMMYALNKLPLSLDTIMLEELLDFTVEQDYDDTDDQKQLTDEILQDITESVDSSIPKPKGKLKLKLIYKRIKDKYNNHRFSFGMRRQTLSGHENSPTGLMSQHNVGSPMVRHYPMERTNSSDICSTVSTNLSLELLRAGIYTGSQDDYYHTVTTTRSTNVLKILPIDKEIEWTDKSPKGA